MSFPAKEKAVYENYLLFLAWLSGSFLFASAKDTDIVFCFLPGGLSFSVQFHLSLLPTQRTFALEFRIPAGEGISGQGQPRAIDWTVKSCGRAVLLVPRQPINANSLLILAAAGPLLKWECCPAEQWFLGYNWLNAWLGRLVLLNDITSAAFQLHQE